MTILDAQSPAASRNLFYRVNDNEGRSDDATTTTKKQQEQRYSESSSSTLRSSFGSSDSRTSNDRRTSEEETLSNIARAAMSHVLSAATSNAFANGTWKERKRTVHEAVYEQRTSTEFSVLARSTVPCTIEEISNVLSSEDSDQLNASLIDILGEQFGYAVNVRKIPTMSTSILQSSMTVKFLSFARTLHRPFSSCKRDVTFLDYVETDRELRTVCRVMQTIARTDGVGKGGAHQQGFVAGDSFSGYVLREDPVTKHTVIFFYGKHFARKDDAATTRSGALRSSTIHTLRKMTKVTSKWVDIALRRRLGTQHILRPSSIPSPSLHSLSSSCFTCDQHFHALFRKKHFCCLCGHYTCGSCSRAANVEERIGIITEKRVCFACNNAVNRKAFEKKLGTY